MSVEKQLRRYIVPNMLAMVGISCYILADTFFISCAAGANGITALNLTLPIYSLIFGIGSMIGVGFAIQYTLTRGHAAARSEAMFSYAVEWEILFSLIFVFMGILCPDKALRLMGADEEILATGRAYLRIVLLFAPCFMLNYTFTSFVRNDHAPKLAMAATLSSSLFNILFDYLFMFPLGMGMAGAALATGLSPLVSILVCMAHYLSDRNTIVFHLLPPSIRCLFPACQAGIASPIGETAGGLTTTAFNYILLGLSGNTAVAAYGIVANFALVATAIFNGIAQGQQPILSERYAKGDRDGIRKVLKHSTQIALGIAACLVLCTLVFSGVLTDIFNSEGSVELKQYATQGMRIYFAGFLFAAINIVKAGYFSATDAPGKSFVIAMSRGLVSITVFAFVLSRISGVTGVWLSFPAAELFTWLLARGIAGGTDS